MLNTSPKLGTYTPVLSNPSSVGVLRCLFLRQASRLDAFSTYPSVRSSPACLVRQQVDQWHPIFVPLVLKDRSSQTSTYPVDIKLTVSRRYEPSSRSLLTSEPLYPWPLLHGQVRKSRHRCSKPRRRYELSGGTTLLSPR